MVAFKSVHRKKNLSHEVAAAIREAIFQGEYPEGSSIPPEPELSEQFGVSRAVVRDATRILESRGMIEIIQGKGMYVTSSAAEAFEEVMLIALKKIHASPSDVDATLRMLLPGACAEAAGAGNDNGISNVEKLVHAYIQLNEEKADEELLSAAYLKVLSALFASSSNKVLNLLGPALLRLTGGKIEAENRDTFISTLADILQPGDSAETRSELRGFLAQAAEIRREES